MTNRELMQMALDALEAMFGKKRQDLPTVNALRDRLAQPEQKPESDDKPFYTIPPSKREWVGLTHEELAWLDEALNLGGRLAVIEAIEAKLKDKNGY